LKFPKILYVRVDLREKGCLSLAFSDGLRTSLHTLFMINAGFPSTEMIETLIATDNATIRTRSPK
jgi:hypothetical protein